MPRRTNRALTVVGLILALAMGALEATVVSTAMPTVIGDLGGIHYYAWVTTAYLLASSVTVPIYGKLADIYGRKPILLFGIALFLLGSAASGAAQIDGAAHRSSAPSRASAPAAMQPMALTIVGDIFDLEERARMQGVFGAVWGLFGLVGPMLGGLIVHHLSWRWVFYINLPVRRRGRRAAWSTQLHERIEKKPHTLDFLGAALLTGGRRRAAPRREPARRGDRRCSARRSASCCSCAFVAVERRATEPVLPLAALRAPGDAPSRASPARSSAAR